MIKKICITSVIVCIVIFLLFAFAWWNINPAMWSDEGRYSCAAAIGAGMLFTTMGICIKESL